MFSKKTSTRCKKCVHLRDLFTFICIQCHKAGQGQDDKNQTCERVKSRQPTGLSLKESYDRAVGSEGS